jgi:hypothetical protein
MSFIAQEPIYVDNEAGKQVPKSTRGAVLLAAQGAVVTDADIERFGLKAPGEDNGRRRRTET